MFTVDKSNSLPGKAGAGQNQEISPNIVQQIQPRKVIIQIRSKERWDKGTGGVHQGGGHKGGNQWREQNRERWRSGGKEASVKQNKTLNTKTDLKLDTWMITKRINRNSEHKKKELPS